MRHFRALAMASALLLGPASVTASFAQNGSGSNVPPATNRSAFPGATSNGTLGTTFGNTNKPTSGTAGGGMSAGNGVKAGGQARAHRTHTTHHHKKHVSTMAPAQ
jgi:hypothetical protein